ncbi:MAG: hypothetical protein FJ296_08740, partial [Planctomycetes bacterium]|nr:hypothetical protein [Planctomycetota bacterium]
MTALLIDLAVKGSLLLALAGAGALLLRRASSAARHLHWQLVLAGLAALPLAAALTPRVEVPVGPLAAWWSAKAAAPAALDHATPAGTAQAAPRTARRDLPLHAALEDARPALRQDRPAEPSSSPATSPAAPPARIAADPPPATPRTL